MAENGIIQYDIFVIRYSLLALSAFYSALGMRNHLSQQELFA